MFFRWRERGKHKGQMCPVPTDSTPLRCLLEAPSKNFHLSLATSVSHGYSRCWERRSFCLCLYLTRFIGFCLEEQQNFCLEGSQHSLLLINANTLSAHLLVQELSSLVVLLKGEILWTWLPYCPLNRGSGEQERRTNIHLFIETSL